MSTSRGVSVSGVSFEAVDLRQINWQTELVIRQTLDIELGVTHYEPAGAARGSVRRRRSSTRFTA